MHHHPNCPTHAVDSSFSFSSSCLSVSGTVCARLVCLSQSLRAHLDALRERGAALQYAVYGSCGLQERGRQLHVASRTGSHAFPRDLRGSHPRDHGGNGEKVENGIAPGERDAAQRKRVGKKSGRPVSVKTSRRRQLWRGNLRLIRGKVSSGKDLSLYLIIWVPFPKEKKVRIDDLIILYII